MLAFSELYNNIVFHLQQHKAMHAGLYFENLGIIVAVEGLLYAENQVMASAPMATIDFPHVIITISNEVNFKDGS